MSVSEVADGGIGKWEVKLKPDLPDEILKKLDYFGHIAITTGQDNPVLSGDSILATAGARFVGPFLKYKFGNDNITLSGASMNYWMGDSDKKGDVHEEELYYNDVTFTFAITNLLPDAVEVGSIEALPGLVRQQFQYTNSRDVIDFIVSLHGAAWHVSNDGKAYVGTPEFLYGSTPTAAIIRHVEGFDQNLKVLPGDPELEADVEDFTTRVIMLANASFGTVVVSEADIDPGLNPYLDLHGNPVKLVRAMQETDTSDFNAAARAEVNLNRFTAPNETITLDLNTSDIRGDLRAGSYVWVHDETARLNDFNNLVRFRGEDLYPVKLRVFELTWPIEQGMGVYFRHYDGTWIDLTPWVEFEKSDVSIVVGDYDRTITGVGGGTTPATRPTPTEGDSSVPAAPNWVFSNPLQPSATLQPSASLQPGSGNFYSSTYSNNLGIARAQVTLNWTQPLNTDSSVISDGSHYEIQYKETLNLDWQSSVVGFDFTRFNLQELTPSVSYQARIRAVDSAKPPNRGAWSAIATFTTAGDNQAPSTPAPAEVAASLIAVQIKHNLGKSTGGTFNLELDIMRMDVYKGTTAGFVPDEVNYTNRIGYISISGDMVNSHTPAIKTFPVSDTVQVWIKVIVVDRSGNSSAASVAAPVTAQLIDAQHVSVITATQVISGEFLGTYGLIGTFETAPSGARFRAGNFGWATHRLDGTPALLCDSETASLIGADSDGNVTFGFDGDDGTVFMVGTLQTGISGQRLLIDGSPSIRFFPQEGETRSALIYSYIPVEYPNDIALELVAIDSDGADFIARHWMLPDVQALAIAPLGEGGGAISSSSVRLDEDSVSIDFNSIIGTAPFLETDEDHRATIRFDATGIRAQAMTLGARDGGFLWLDRAANGDVWLGKKTTGTVDNYINISNAGMNLKGPNNGGLAFGATTYDMRVQGDAQVVLPDHSAWRSLFVRTIFESHPSEIRFKENISPLPESGLTLLRNAPITQWNYTEEINMGDGINIGPMAEDMPDWAIYPIPIKPKNPDEDEDIPEMKTINQRAFIAMIADAVRQLDEEMDQFRTKKPQRKTIKQLLSNVPKDKKRFLDDL